MCIYINNIPVAPDVLAYIQCGLRSSVPAVRNYRNWHAPPAVRTSFSRSPSFTHRHQLARVNSILLLLSTGSLLRCFCGVKKIDFPSFWRLYITSRFTIILMQKCETEQLHADTCTCISIRLFEY